MQWHIRVSKPLRKAIQQDNCANTKTKHTYHWTYFLFFCANTENTYIYKVFPAISFPQLFCHVNLYLFTCTQVGQLTKLILNFQMMYLSWSVRQKFLRVRLSNRHYENLAGFCQKQRRFLLVLQSLLSESSQVFTEKSVQTQLSVKTIQRQATTTIFMPLQAVSLHNLD